MASKVPRKTAIEAGSGRRLSDLAYRRIMGVLFERKLPAGSFVSQAELVALTDVPVGPLRDALRVLEAEGVLTVHPRTGVQFVKPGLELTRSTYQFRAMIEVAAVAIYAEIAPDEEILELTRRNDEALTAVKTNGLTPAVDDQMEALEQLLHGSIVAILNNPLIDSAYRRIHNYLRLIRLDRRVTTPLAIRSLNEHAAIIDACRQRDSAAAVAALQAHFAAALQRYLGFY